MTLSGKRLYILSRCKIGENVPADFVGRTSDNRAIFEPVALPSERCVLTDEEVGRLVRRAPNIHEFVKDHCGDNMKEAERRLSVPYISILRWHVHNVRPTAKRDTLRLRGVDPGP